ncbi:MAG TPA: beta-ketoacyl-ACP synthase III [Terriglobales bacterium]|nr:beta-ketoacyl-ACP synthase III [Terriglobales bacterium]
MGLKIIATGSAVPKRAVTNEDLSKLLDTSDEWIVSRTGIKSRFISTGETMTDLAAAAAGIALGRAGLSVADMDCIICATMGGDYHFPSLACCVGERMGAHCPAFDVNAACSGFIYALDVADGYFARGKAKNILLICAEMMSKLVDWNDRASCVLFADGAAACVLTEGDALKYLRLTASGNVKALNAPAGTGNNPFRENRASGFTHMEGQDVYKYAVSVAEEESKKALDALQMTVDDIDYFLLHQANKRIIDTARVRMKQPEEKFPVNIDRYGNTSAATLPILLNEMLEAGKIQKGAKLLFSAFGAGLTSGTCVMIWE